MNIKDFVFSFIEKEYDLTAEQKAELKETLNQPINENDLKNIQDINKKWQNKVEVLEKQIQNNDFSNIKLEPMPKDDCIEVYAYYFYLVAIKQKLYKYRGNFEVLKLLRGAIYSIIENVDYIKENLIQTEMIRQKANNYNKDIENAREKAENEVNKIKFEKFKEQTGTIDFLYERALKENRQE